MSRGSQPTTIDVAIVNWNTSRAALTAADAFLHSEKVETRVTIVDNASVPEERKLLEESCPPEVALRLSEENAGYGIAANLALADGAGELICVSNADVIPQPGALAELAITVLADPQGGMAGPVFGGDTDRYHADLPGAVTMLGRIFVGSFRTGAAPSPPPGAVAEVGQPSGACFVMRRDVWESLGGFDEGFFLWYEDVDLAKRLRDAGYRNLVVGSAWIDHLGAESFEQIDRGQLQAIRLPSVERYIGKHHRRIAPIAKPLLRLASRLRTDGAATAPSSFKAAQDS